MGVTILGTLKLRKGRAKVSDSERTRASAPAHDRASAWLQPSCLTHPTTAPCASVSMCEWYVCLYVVDGYAAGGPDHSLNEAGRSVSRGIVVESFPNF